MATTSRHQVPDFDAKNTPSGIGDMRFGGGRRPTAAPEGSVEDKKPVNLRRVRNRTDKLYGVAFGVVALLMVAGAASLAIPTFFPSAAAPTVQDQPVDDPGAGEPTGELQGGVKVHKGFQK